MAVLFLFLLLSKLQFFVANAPELSKLLLFLLCLDPLLLLALNLKCAAAIDGCLHLSLLALLLLKEPICLVLGLCHLPVKDLLGVVLERMQLSNLLIDHLLALSLLLLESLLFTFFLHVLKLLELFVVLLNLDCLLLISQAFSLLLLQLLLVHLGQVCAVLGHLL